VYIGFCKGGRMEDGKTWRVHRDEEIKKALLDNSGLISPAAKQLGLERQSLEHRLKTNPELKAWRVTCVEDAKDKAESKVQEAIDKSEPWAIQFFLKTQGRDRGYGDELAVNVNSYSTNINYEFDLNRLSVEEVEKLYDFVSRAKLDSGKDEGVIIDSTYALPDAKKLDGAVVI
jgi:hypothetical protein